MSPRIAPWLSVHDAERAVDFYKAAFGAVELYRMPDQGAIEVAQLSVGGADFWVQNDAGASPKAGLALVRMILSVDDPDAAFNQAVSAGATVVAAIHEEYGWRTGRITDPFGHDWEMSKQVSAS